MFIPADELVLAELGSAMGANDGAEPNVLRLADVPFSDILPIAGDDEVIVTEARLINVELDKDALFRDNMAVCLSSIRKWDGQMDANL